MPHDRVGAEPLRWQPTPREEFAYAMGRCADLALALQRRLNWPMVAIMEPDHEEQSYGNDWHRPVHVMLRGPEGRVLDIVGLRSVKEVGTWARGFVDDPAVMKDWWVTDYPVDRVSIREWIKEGYLQRPTPDETRDAQAVAARMVRALHLRPSPKEASPGPSPKFQ